MLMLPRLPRTRVIYLTSQPIPDTIVDYYLHLLQGVPPEHARARLTLLPCFDSSVQPPGCSARRPASHDSIMHRIIWKRRTTRGLTPSDLVDIAVLHGLHYDGTVHEGVVFHLIGALSEFGKLGIVCVGASTERAEDRDRRAVAVLDQEQGRG